MSLPEDPRGPPGEAPLGGTGAFSALAGATPEVVEDVDAALADLERYVSASRSSTRSSQVRLDRDHVLELIRIVRARLPVALRSARWLIKERSDYLERARRDAEELIDQVKAEAARMVHRTEVVKQAEVRARKIIEGAEEQARRQRLELEDYCDEHLARFEEALVRALGNVRDGRRRLQGPSGAPGPEPPEPPGEDADGLFFDQDHP
ncbi:MAG: hypothetical protein OXG47_00385 [bacterium]|nr:hypothetical protein [bacterium]